MARAPFKMGLPAVASRPFTFAGTKYERGTAFPYQALKLTPFEMWGQWLAGNVDFEREAPKAITPPAAPPQERREKRWQQRR